MFKAWEARARTLTEGEPVYRQLHGLEAWFRSPQTPPPRWKMAVATLLGVLSDQPRFLALTLGEGDSRLAVCARQRSLVNAVAWSRC